MALSAQAILAKTNQTTKATIMNKKIICLITALVQVTSICGMKTVASQERQEEVDNAEETLYLNKELLKAAKSGDEDRVSELILQGNVDVNIADDSGTSALAAAAEKGYILCVRALITAGADLNRADASGCTALMAAAKFGQVLCLRQLITSGANLHLQNVSGLTALGLAVKAGFQEGALALIAAGADVNKPIVSKDRYGTYMTTPLIEAARRGLPEFVAALIKVGADVHQRDEKGRTALLWASEAGHADCVRVLAKANADIHVMENDGYTAWTWAAFNGHAECLEELIDAAPIKLSYRKNHFCLNKCVRKWPY